MITTNTLIKSCTLSFILLLGFQVNGQVIDLNEHIKIVPHKEKEIKSPEVIKQEEMAESLKTEISLQVNEAWATNNDQLLEPYLSKEIKTELKDLKKLMTEIDSFYSSPKFTTILKNGAFETTYLNLKEKQNLRIRHFFRENEDCGYQIFMIIKSIQQQDYKTTGKIHFPAINGEISTIQKRLMQDKFSSTKEQYALSKEGIDKARQALRDSTIARFGLNDLIANFFEASVKMDRPTSEITDFKFPVTERSFDEILQQYTLISYAEKGQFEKLKAYTDQMTAVEKRRLNSFQIKAFYRIPNERNTYRPAGQKILELLRKK